MKSADLIRIAEILARAHKIKLVKSDHWAADIKTREVFYNGQDIYALEEDQILGLILHETAHIHYTTESGPYAKHEELMQSAMNLIEDIAIEELIGGDYPNAKEILDSTRETVLDKLLTILPTIKAADQEKALLYGGARFHGRGYDRAVTPYEQVGQLVGEYMDSKRTEILTRTQTKELIPIAEHIVELIVKGGTNKAGKKIQGMGDLTDAQKHERQMTMARAEGQGNKRSRGADQGIMQAVKKELINAMKNGGEGYGTDIDRISDQVDFIDEIADQASLVGKKVRATLKRNQSMEFGGRYRTGKLRPKSIRRLVVNNDDKPFQRRVVKSNQSYAFVVAADTSGSMWTGNATRSPGSKALTGLWMVAEALRMANVPRSIMIFADRTIVISPMGKQQVRWTDMADETQLRRAGGGTDIGLAMNEATKQLKGVRAERKIMIILTDGGDDGERVQRAYQEAKKQGIECIAIELGHGALQEVFKSKESVVLQGSEQRKIGEAFISVLQQTVKVDRGVV